MASLPSLEEILNQKQTYSELSEDPSFTLTDILQQPIDEDLIDDNEINQEDMDVFFQDDQEPPQQQTLTSSKVYQFPSLDQQSQENSQTQTSPLQNQNQDQILQSPQLKNKSISQGKMISSKSIRVPSKSLDQSQVSDIQPYQRLQKMPLLPIQQIENMSFVMLKNVTNLFEDPNNTSIGIPTAISATGNRFLALGTSMGNIVIFEIGVRGNKILGTPQQRKFGYITSLSISRDNKYLVAGHESGLVALWDLYYFSLIKQEINNRCKVLQVLFCSQTSQNFISNDAEGNTYIYTIEKYIWTNLKCNKLLEKSQFPFYDIRYHQLQSGSSVVGLCTLEYILLISIKPKVSVIGKIVRPDGIGLNYLPNIQLGRCLIEGLGYRGDVKPMYDVFIISWGKTIYLYRFVPGTTSFGTVQQLFVYQHPTVVYNIEFLSQNIFITLDKHQIFRTIRIDISIPSALQTLNEIENKKPTETSKQPSQYLNINIPTSSSKHPNITFNIIHSKQMTEEVIYQRLLKSKQQKYIKSFRNTLINCTFNSQQKQIFFITKNSVYRARLQKWTTFLSSVVNQQKNLKMGMKIALELKNQNLNIFSQKVEMTGKKAEKSMHMFCQVGRIFLQEGLKDVKQSNIERARNRQRAQMQVKQIAEELRELYEYTIEYFIELKSQKYLFETIYGKIIKNLPSFQYWQIFIESLKPFIISQKLTRIPSIQVFKEILQYFSSNKSSCPQIDNMKLIDKMITNLDSQSLHYQNAVSILADNKLFKGLAYICSVNKDFISPCNKLLMKMMEASQNRLQNAQKQYFEVLQLYLTKLINGLYINDKKVPSRIYDSHVLRDVSLWLSFEDTLNYFIKGSQIQSDKQPKNINKFKTLMNWVSKLFEETAKLRQKGNFHQLFSHLIQALQDIQNKQLMKKSAQSLAKRNNVNALRYQLSLLVVKFGRKIQLKETQLTFFIKTLYLKEVKKIYHDLPNVQYAQVHLQEQLHFIKKYFQSLHLIKLQDNFDEYKTPYQQIVQTYNDWSKYLYNFMVTSIQAKKLAQRQRKMTEDQQKLNQPTQIAVKDQSNKSQNNEKDQNNLSDQLQNSQVQAKSQHLLEKSGRSSSSSSKSVKQIQSKKLIESLFSPGAINALQIPSQSSLLKRRKQIASRINQLNLTSLNLTHDISEPRNQNKSQNGSELNQNNYVLIDFILKNFSFEEIDPHIESLIKLNSQLVIVYILEHYELEIVNKKIELIQNEEVKYFVVRRILKMIRKIKKQQQDSDDFYINNTKVNNQKDDMSKTDNLFRVWGNKHRSYAKKVQSKNIEEKNSVLQKIRESNLSESVIMFYLSCLAKYKKQKRVYSQLKLFMSDYAQFINQVLELMKTYELHSCIGLIYQQINDLPHAFQFYQLVYNERMEVNVKKLVLVQHCHGRFLRQIFNSMLDISQKINTNEQWMKLLQAVLQPLIEDNKFMRRKKQQVIDLIQKVYTANPNHAFIQQFGEVIESTLLQVSSHIPTEEISSVFSHYSELMNKTFMLNCLKSTMHTYSKSIFIYETSNSMVIHDQANEFDKIYHENKIKGLNCMPVCQKCSQLIQIKDKVVVYKCSHIYHKKCLLPDQQNCIKCVLIEVGESDNQLSSCDLEDLKNKKKESSMKLIESNQKINTDEVTKNEGVNSKEDLESQTQRINTIYRSLAFDEFLQKDELKFDQFRKDYDLYLSKYQ